MAEENRGKLQLGDRLMKTARLIIASFEITSQEGKQGKSERIA
jgi:hypothetical protein